MIRPIIVVVTFLFVVLLIIPTLVVQWMPSGVGQVKKDVVKLVSPKPEQINETTPQIHIAVYRTQLKKIENVPLENYIQGVIASEMPSEFELEALKAQALTARTYIIRRLVERDYSDTPEGSIVTDTEKHQVYQNEQELRERWGIDYEQKISRINQAVNETVGQVITYQGRPIDATFFSTSNGFTENSEEYWNQEIPYLRSVESPWDQASPRYQDQLRMSIKEFQEKLGVQLSIPVSNTTAIGEIVSRTEGNRVKEVKIGDKIFTGKEVRELLGLDSSHFEWQRDGGQVLIRTFGWGHGVGMSQWGANGMAEEGYAAEDIVKYYYQNIHVQDYRQWIAKK